MSASLIIEPYSTSAARLTGKKRLVVCEGIEFINLPIDVESITLAHEEWETVLTIAAKVPHRDTGVPITIKSDARMVKMRFDESIDPKRELADWVYEVVRSLLLHELDEAFHVNGVRVRDPHREAFT